jgi:hypothetical protein
VSSGAGSESNGWLQDASGCLNAEISSNNYFSSASYMNSLASTKNFYETIVPVVNATFAASTVTYKNAYTSMSYKLRGFHNVHVLKKKLQSSI